MNEARDVYNKRYEEGYRENLTGWEFARYAALEHVIKKVLKLGAVKKTLDYGCGSGMHVSLWQKSFPESDLYFGDISAVALKQLNEKYPQYTQNCQEIVKDRLSYESNQFDVIVSVEVMEHVEDLKAYVREINRLLKPGGYFIWTTPCGNWFSIEHIFSFLTMNIEKTKEGYRRWKWEDSTHIRRLKTAEIKKILSENKYDRIGFRMRSHIFSFLCTYLFRGPLRKIGEKLMFLDYLLFRMLPNGASMIGFARKGKDE